MDYIQRMRNLREDSDKTQQQIADYLGTSQTMYADMSAEQMNYRFTICLLYVNTIMCPLTIY